MQPPVPVIGFFDIDSVLRGLGQHSAGNPVEALARLEADGIATVLCSTRTRAELERVQQELGVCHPFICEAGSAMFIPAGYFGFDVPGARLIPGYHVVECGRSHGAVVETLHRVAHRLDIGIRGFSDMSVEEVAIDQGMSLLQARLAKLREYGEMFRICDEGPATRTRLFKALRLAQLRCVSRRGINHVAGVGDISRAAARLRSMFERAFGSVVSLAVTDIESGGTVIAPSLRCHDWASVVPVTSLAGLAAAARDAVHGIRTPRIH
jgi:predicted mannosyl-3-phosphoglycerate phosphatase (HAD superfamily)